MIVRVISFKNTTLFKRGVWLTAAALIAFVGARIQFLPQATLWSNLSGVKRVASRLTDRANRPAPCETR
jgi:hypothetical protein